MRVSFYHIILTDSYPHLDILHEMEMEWNANGNIACETKTSGFETHPDVSI